MAKKNPRPRPSPELRIIFIVGELNVFPQLVRLLQLTVTLNVSWHGHVRSFAVKGLRNSVLDYIRQHGAISNVGETADVLGVARPSLTRILADLQAEGLVERTRDGYYVSSKTSILI